MKLSVVFATLNRFAYLLQSLDSIEHAARSLEHEVIVVDGGSTDGTLDFLRAQADLKRLVLIEQGKPLGCVKAFNAGFWQAQGEYVFNFNDDAVIVGDALVNAIQLIDHSDEIGQVAIAYGLPGATPEISMMKVAQRLVPYANFGVTPKCLGDRVGWWGDYLYRYAGDNELSMQVFAAGCKVVGLPVEHGSIVHYAAEDATRVNSPNDTKLFYGKWARFRWDS